MNLRSVILAAVMLQALYGWLCLTRPETNPARYSWAAMCFCYAAWDLLFLVLATDPLSALAYFDFDAASNLLKGGIGVSFITRAANRHSKKQGLIDTSCLLPGFSFCALYIIRLLSGNAIPGNVFPDPLDLPTTILIILITGGFIYLLVWLRREKRKKAKEFLTFFLLFALLVITTQTLLIYLQILPMALKAYSTAALHILIACTGMTGLAFLDYLKPTIDITAQPLLDLINRPILVFDTDGNLQFANTCAKILLQLQSATRKILSADGADLGSLVIGTVPANTAERTLEVSVTTRKNKNVDLCLSVSAIIKNNAVCGYVAASLLQEQHEEAQLKARLSKREQEVLALLKDGYSNIEIAEKLFITEGTVKLHAHRIYAKTRQ